MTTETTIGTPYIALSISMQAFFERRGMWRDGNPAGLLASWLGERCPWKPTGGGVVHWTTHEGLDALAADAVAVAPQAWPTFHQRAQFLRRLREAAVRSGRVNLLGALSPTAAILAASFAPATTGAYEALPFEPLSIPAEGTRARKAFADHVMRTMREFVDYTQGSEFQGSAP